jgi:hypothetical protein
MPLPKEYYHNKLYPFQDRVLNAIAQSETDFYLTGGTALSRWYLHHRYSEDLDFFINDSHDFSDQVDRALKALKHFGIRMSIQKRAEDFVRIVTSTEDAELKIDFVNDIPYRSGKVESFDLFPRIDGWWNILSNKICALERREPKDVADILFLCKKYSFEWADVFQEAKQKTTYIDPLDISVVLSEFPKEYFSKVQWIEDFSPDNGYNDLHSIAKDILQRETNSLVIS